MVAKADQERKASVIRAEGEAEAAQLISKAMFAFHISPFDYLSHVCIRAAAGTGFIEVRRIDAAKEVAHTLANAKNIVYLPSGGGANGGSGLLLNVDSK